MLYVIYLYISYVKCGIFCYVNNACPMFQIIFKVLGKGVSYLAIPYAN